MSLEVYKVIHLVGVFMVLTGLTGLLAVRMVGADIPARPRRLFFLTHGLGLVITLVAGFGMAARLGLMQTFPLWLLAKMGIWLILGGSIALAKRKGQIGGPLLACFIALGAFAAYLAIMKPF